MSTIKRIRNDEHLAEIIADWASGNDSSNADNAIQKLQGNPKPLLTRMAKSLWGDDLAMDGESVGDAVNVLEEKVAAAIKELRFLMG